jgi:hypothetical protein
MYSFFSKEHQMDTYKLEVGIVFPTLLDIFQFHERHTLYHIAQNLDFGGPASTLALLLNGGFGKLFLRPLSFIFNWSLVFFSGIPPFHSSMAALFSASENGVITGGLLLDDWLLCDRDALI